MSKPPDKPQQRRTVQICSIACVAIGIAVFQVVAPRYFPPPPGGGMNYTRILVAGLVGGVCAAIGAGIGKLIDALRGA